MVEWTLTSNDGLQSLTFTGEASISTKAWLGSIVINTDDYSPPETPHGANENIWRITLGQFPLSRSNLTDLQLGLRAWRDGSYQSGFTVSHSSDYYHEFVFRLHPTEPRLGKALFEVDGISWALNRLTFQMTVDQSCVLETLVQMDSILRESE